MRITQRYICRGCGYPWTREWKAPVEVASTFPMPSPRIVVPEDFAPCCAPEADDDDAD